MRKRAGVVLIDKSTRNVLLIKRIKNNNIYFIIPGGGVELNENYMEAARREIYEELNYKVQNLFELGNWNNEIYYYSHVEKLSQFEICGEEKARETTQNSYKPIWVNVDEILDLNLFPVEMKEKIVNLFIDNYQYNKNDI